MSAIVNFRKKNSTKAKENISRQYNLPNVLFIMTDQQRYDTIAALGNDYIYTPNFDRLVRRGVVFTKGYTTCPVCAPARYTIRTGCEPPATTIFSNHTSSILKHPGLIEKHCGKYLARTMGKLGYRTFGIGKFHTHPWNEDIGYQIHLHSEELYNDTFQRENDAYASFIAQKHPEYDFIEMLMGEKTEMYYMPQMSPLPAGLTVESWAADRAVEQISSSDRKPYFGMVSFIGPHPPCAPPIPFNRMYNPDCMPNPIYGEKEIDHMDEQIPFMNYSIWAEGISNPHARIIRARYYGEVSYIDSCLGRILDAVEARDDADNTLICFFSDHGDQLGDHQAWQKENFFEASCHIPFLLSWPERIAQNTQCEELICLTDLFGIATSAAGSPEIREGIDVLGMLGEKVNPREYLCGYYETPGSPHFKIMVRDGDWKYIFMANGGREQLFNLSEDPHELHQCLEENPAIVEQMRQRALETLSAPETSAAVEKDTLKSFPFRARKYRRIYQFDSSRGIQGFPDKPEAVFKKFSSY